MALVHFGVKSRRLDGLSLMRATIAFGFFLMCCAISNAQDKTGMIMFYREPHFATGDFKPALYCDDVELAQIENGTYFQVTAPVGLHKCTVETSQHPPIEVNVTEGKITYVHFEFEGGPQKPRLSRKHDGR